MGDDALSYNLTARQKWELERLKDPATGKIPDGIRAKELAFAATLPVANDFMRKSGDIWEQMGPWNVGGRTRAIAIDITNEKVLIAGGVTGGLWRSENEGTSWTKTTTQTQVNAITSVVQDTRAGKTNIWYATTGELTGSSASKGGAYFSGNGFLKSTDGGKSWLPLGVTGGNTPQFDSDFDGGWNIAVNTASKDSDVVFAAVYGGIYRSLNAGATWQRRRGGTSQSSPNPSYTTDVVITKTGIVYATLSDEGPQRGIWRSSDNGNSWANILPPNFPTAYKRMVIGLVPQDENHMYILALTDGKGKLTKNFRGDEEWNSLWKYTYISGDGSGAGGRWEDRSASIPDFPGDFEKFNAQGAYNYLVKVHPGDSNYVYIGGTGLFRSADGFRTNTKITKVGGYAVNTKRPDFKLYPNHHPDQHNLIFFPSNPNKAISTHDGGISLTTDAKATDLKWESLNNGYVTTQFYTVAMNHAKPGDNTIIGGLQDNGTLFTNKYDSKNPWNEIFSYDGAFCHIAGNGQDYYVAKQEAGLYRIRLDSANNRVQSARLDPPNNANYKFINPWCTDPNEDKRIFMLHNFSVWRHNDVTEYPLSNFLDSSRKPGNWQELTNTTNAIELSAISVSEKPAGILFYGTETGKIYKVPNATTGNPTPIEITGTNMPGGNINNICIHPEDADKIIVVFTNYGIQSLFYTENGGQNWVNISGNLEQSPDGTGNGPSCRWATFIKTESGYGVLVATSVGLFGTASLNGAATVWLQQSPLGIGNAICEMIKIRRSDSRVVVATHGAGVFAANVSRSYHLTGIEEKNESFVFSLYPNPATERITITTPENHKNTTYTIWDMSGKVLGNHAAQGTETPIDVANLKPGTYVLRATTPNSSGSRFFIKK